MFLQQHFVLFDKVKSRIGFINNHRQLVKFIDNEIFVLLLRYIAFGVVILMVGIICLKDVRVDLEGEGKLLND